MSAFSFDRELCEELHALVAASLSGELTEGQRQRLEFLVCNNETARDLYLACMQTSLDLRTWAGGPTSDYLDATSEGENRHEEQSSSELLPRRRSLLDRASRHPLIPSVGITVAIFLAISLGLASIPVSKWIAGGGKDPESRQPEAPTDSEYVAILNSRQNAKWLEDTRPSLSDPRLRIGRRLVLASGLIEVKYYTGARVIIEGPAEFVVGATESADQLASQEDAGGSANPDNSGYLKLGKLVARIDGNEAQGFNIDTPMGNIEDLGTEFGVRVAQDGRTQLHVFEGEVSTQFVTAKGIHTDVVAVGSGLVADSRGVTIVPSKESTASASAFVRSLAPASTGSTGIVAAWSFDRDFSADVGGAAFDLKAVGGATAGESVGKFGQAARFERANRQYAFTGGNVLRQGKDHSYSAWYKLDVTDITGRSRYFVLETMADDTPSNVEAWSISYGLRQSSDDIGQVNILPESDFHPAFDIAGGNATESNGDAKWHNIIVTYDADGGVEPGKGRHRVYLDGNLAGTFDNDDPLAAVGGLVIGGHRQGTGRNWDGLIDDVAIFDHVLSNSAIQTLQSTSVLADLLNSTTVVDESADVLGEQARPQHE